MTDRDQAILWARDRLTETFYVIDTETTGLDSDDEAVSIGIVDDDGETFLDTKICHTKRSSPKALATHQITWEETRSAVPFKELYPEIHRILDNQIIVGYNIPFDIRILRQTCERYDLAPPTFTVAHDVGGAFAKFCGGIDKRSNWKRLEVAANHFGIATNGAHTAAGDALTTLEVLKAMARAKLSTEE